MKVLKRLIPYIKPIHHFLPEYLIYITFGILFGLLNFSLLIPVLNVLFKITEATVVESEPVFSLSITYFIDLFNYHFNRLVVEKGEMYALGFVCGLIFLSTVLSNFFKYMSSRVLMRLRFRVMEKIRNDLFYKMSGQSLRFFNNHRKSDLLNVITNEVQEIELSLITSLQVWLRDPFIMIGYFIGLLYISPKLTLFTIVFFPVSGILISIITKRLKKFSFFSQELLARILGFVDEHLSGIRVVQSFVSEKYARSRFADINRSFSQNSKKMYRVRELASPTSETLGVIVVLVLVLYGGSLLIPGDTALTGSMFISYLAMYTQILPPLKNLSNTTTSVQRGIVAAEKIFETIDAPVDIQEKATAVDAPPFASSIELRNVTFRYENKAVLSNINLVIPKGKTIALVGESGSGKSTLADLVPRFYDPSEGAILLDGRDLRDLSLESLRKQIAIVSQEAVLFHDTIFSNIAFAQPDATKEDVVAASKVANAHQFIEQSENGYDTIIGDRGMKLSGGQRQRLTIARAIFKDAPILILDEATSALDTESERLVQQAINELMKNRTSLVIAHRLSTIRHADEIIVMHKGEIVERGNHETLIEKNGYYKRLVDLQEVK